MRTVCVHFPKGSFVTPPDAVYWVDDDGQIQVYEPKPSPATILASMTMFNKAPSVRWVPYFYQLAERWPYIDGWATYEVRLDMDPKDFLDLLIKSGG